MKKLAFVLALVLTLGVFGSMFAVGAAAPATYELKAWYRGYSDSRYAGPTYGAVTQFSKIDVDDLNTLSIENPTLPGSLAVGLTAFVFDFGAKQTVNTLYVPMVKDRGAPEKFLAGPTVDGLKVTYWYSVDGENYTEIKDVKAEGVGDYYEYDPSRNGADKGYAKQIRLTFDDVDARWLMIGVETPADDNNGFVSIAYSKGKLYCAYEENPKTGDTLSIVALGTVAAVAGIVIVSKKKKNV